jgi:hypothetical protein
MSQQQQPEEMPEYHTIQVFREADMILEHPAAMSRNVPTSDAISAPTFQVMPNTDSVTIQTALDLIPYDQSDDGIGGDWAIDVEMDVAAEDVPPPSERRGSESTLYSFYFETPIGAQQQQQQQDVDDFTITSQETESFHNTEDLSLLQDSSSFWETGLASTANESTLQRCASPAHVSVGEERLMHQPSSQTVSRMC